MVSRVPNDANKGRVNEFYRFVAFAESNSTCKFLLYIHNLWASMFQNFHLVKTEFCHPEKGFWRWWKCFFFWENYIWIINFMVLSNIIIRWFICWSDLICVYYVAVKYLLAKHLDFPIITKTKTGFNVKIITTSCKFSWFTSDSFEVRESEKWW